MRIKNNCITNMYYGALRGLPAIALIVSFCSCRKYVEVAPPATQLVSNTIFSNDGTAMAAVAGMYSKMMESTAGNYINTKLMIYPGLSADELQNFSSYSDQAEISGNAISAANSTIGSMWSELYQHIYRANTIVEGLNASTGVTAALKKQLLGEAEFVRAYCHFYLVNLFGDIPYITTTDYQVNALVPRTPRAEVYQKIIADLQDAQGLLAPGYSYSNNERVRPNSFAATALLARVYLYQRDWAKAEAQATAVINNTAQYSLVADLNGVFLKNSTEAIWQLMPVLSGYNTIDGLSMIPVSTAVPSSGAMLSGQLLNAFESGDSRRSSWVGSLTISGITYIYPYKYKVRTGTALSEYYMMLRLAEQYLIRAEARAQQNNLGGAAADVNMIRTRAGLANLPASLTQAQTLAAIRQERRIELFCELGHRWLDLKRNGDADAVLGPLKTGWSSTDVLYPIPLQQVLNDPNMTQNAGY